MGYFIILLAIALGVIYYIRHKVSTNPVPTPTPMPIVTPTPTNVTPSSSQCNLDVYGRINSSYNDPSAGAYVCYQIGSGSVVNNAFIASSTSCSKLGTISNIPSGSVVKLWLLAINSGAGAVATGTPIQYFVNTGTVCPVNTGKPYCLNGEPTFTVTVNNNSSVALNTIRSGNEFVTC